MKNYQDFIISRDLVFNPCQFICSELVIEKESTEYAACSFKLNNLHVKFRIGKITPTKIGQFVTLWKRIDNGPIQPYNIHDNIDLVIIATRMGDNLGQFIFPKEVLYKHGIFAKNGKGGKRAIRVYPPWDRTINVQAKKPQAWQLQYFLEIPKNKPIDYVRVKMLYLLNKV